MGERPKRGFRLQQFTKDVLYDSVVGITAGALRIAALLLLAAMVALFATGWDVPAWTLVLMGLLAIGLMYLTRRVAGREATELRPKLEAAEGKLDRHDSYGTNICSIMDNFQRVLAGDIKGLSVPDFIERGILNAGRDVMQENGHASDLRMSVLLASEGHFSMVWASGHNVGSQKKYKQPIDKTVSKIAFEKKGPQVWKDVTEEERGFETNPHATRSFRSMVSIPILLGDKPADVFNIVTERVDAFDAADVNYLTSLGSVVQTAFGVAIKEIKREEKEEKHAAAKPVKARPESPRKARLIAPRSAPSRGVQSQGSPEEKEASDD